MSDQVRTGGCLCGAVRYRTSGSVRPVISCHCEQCRRTSGHHVAASASCHADFELTEDRGLTWYRSSDWAQRGFCSTCGSSLFYQFKDADEISIHAGTFDQPSGLRRGAHIFTADLADYYDLTDDLPQFPDHNHDVTDW